MKRWLLMAVFAGAPATGLAATADNQPLGASKEAAAAPEKFKLPSGARLLSASHATELRAFPEMIKPSKEGAEEDVGIVGVSATDRLYRSNKSYRETVAFFDKQFMDLGATKIDRTTSPTATGWKVRFADGGAANVIVRNTSPATIETVEAIASAGQLEEKVEPQGNEPEGNEPQRTPQKNEQQMPQKNEQQQMPQRNDQQQMPKGNE